MLKSAAVKPERVVIQFGFRTLKGNIEAPAWNSIEDLLGSAIPVSPQTFRIRHLGSDFVEEIATESIKAVFFVNTFEGNSDHIYLNFHSKAPVANGVWVRVQFRDGEVMEGLVNNSLRSLVDPGFFLLPTDPDSNNILVYVVKDWLVDYQVLGLRRL